MRSEERHENSKLVPTNDSVVRIFTIKARHIRASKRIARDTDRQQNLNCSLELFEARSIIASPVGSIFLRPKVESAREHERSPLIIVPLKHSSVGGLMLERPVHIMNITMLNSLPCCRIM